MTPAQLADYIIRTQKRLQTHDVGDNPDAYRRKLREALNRRGYFRDVIVLALVPDTTQIVARKVKDA